MFNESKRCLIIAEAGVNHNGSLDLAHKLVDAAADAGADIVKFQTFRTEQLVAHHAPKAQYQKRTTDASENQFEMIKKLELTQSDHEALILHCKNREIEFLSTPFDASSLVLLTKQFGLSTINVSSGNIPNAPFLLDIARSSKRVILSTGMSTLAEIEAALGVLAFGFLQPTGQPRDFSFEEAYASDAGQSALLDRVTLLHCTTEYPAPCCEVNLRAMDTMGAAFGLPVGYSDHTQGIHIPVAAVARGAIVIEKHFTLDRTLPGPDHNASLEPEELRAMVLSIRDVENALGNGIKRPTASEWKNRGVARKSLVAAQDLMAGDSLAMACKRPGTGISPFAYWKMSGQTAARHYAADELIDG